MLLYKTPAKWRSTVTAWKTTSSYYQYHSQSESPRHASMNLSSTEQLTANATQKWQSGEVCETQFSVIFIVLCFLPEHLLNHAVFWEMINNSGFSTSLLIGWKCRWVYWSWCEGFFSSSLKIHCKFHCVKGFQLRVHFLEALKQIWQFRNTFTCW